MAVCGNGSGKRTSLLRLPPPRHEALPVEILDAPEAVPLVLRPPVLFVVDAPVTGGIENGVDQPVEDLLLGDSTAIVASEQVGLHPLHLGFVV